MSRGCFLLAEERRRCQHPKEHATGEWCACDEHQVHLRDGTVVASEVETIEPLRQQVKQGIDDEPGDDIGGDPPGPTARVTAEDIRLRQAQQRSECQVARTNRRRRIARRRFRTVALRSNQDLRAPLGPAPSCRN